MENIQQAIKKLLEVFSVLIMSVMSIMVFVNVVLRYGFNSSLTTSEDGTVKNQRSNVEISMTEAYRPCVLEMHFPYAE